MPPKSHHYNPKVYLRQFVNPGKKNVLWEFDLRQGTAEPSSPKRSGCEDYYHSFDTAEGVRDDASIEESFKNIGNKLPKLFKLLRNQSPIPTDAWGILFLFASLQRARCPKAIDSMQTGLSEIHAKRFELIKSTPSFAADIKKRGFDPELIRNTEFEITADRGTTLLMMLSVFADGKLARLFARMKWSFLVAPPAMYFWTSDDPVCCWADREPTNFLSAVVAPRHSDVEITFPLSRRICAFATWKSQVTKLYTAATPEQVNTINHRTIFNGWRFVYGPTNDAHVCGLVIKIVKRRIERAKAEH